MSNQRRSQRNQRLGGIIHTYQRYDPAKLPSPTKPPPDLVSGAFEHLMMFGDMRELTPEELANAVHLDPSEIQGLGPSLDALIAMLEERKRRILETYETERVLKEAAREYSDIAKDAVPPPQLAERYAKESRAEHLRGLERLWYEADRVDQKYARDLLHVMHHLAEKYEIDDLAAKYAFAGRTSMDIPKALAIKEELETIDRLLEQLRQAMKSAQVAVIDMDALARFAEPGDLDQLTALQQQIADYIQEMAERQGLELTRDGYQLTPKAYRLFQSRLLDEIFTELQAARSGRHSGPVAGDGAVEITATRAYQFGDSPAQVDVPQTLINAMLREHQQFDAALPRARPEDIEVHLTRNQPKCASAVVMDMSGSMRYGGQYINVKRMSLALDGLIRKEYPGDYLQFIEMYTFARPRHISEVPQMMPKPVTLNDPIIQLRADMSDEHISEFDIPPHFTNIQHALDMCCRFLSVQDTPNRQIFLITDGLPTAHFEQEQLYLLYPPHERTEQETMRAAHRCAREGITINVFLLPNWSQSEEDVQFAHRMAEATRGRVFFTGGNDLDRFVVWDYVQQRRTIIH